MFEAEKNNFIFKKINKISTFNSGEIAKLNFKQIKHITSTIIMNTGTEEIEFLFLG